ncbi:hypothetical protein H9L17_14620 [Thermomonas brevis]|uniref:UrcA family protein n=1 Tax=Thermomonas brevis TaxID=215691 RepID=A0A7G9QSQ5_9GAMM|nr:hypothetical protein [Thermomonas brevis]QNN46380.1 hypothetical protein H9L17_14620 [Thermomonas brevis]
MCLSRCLAALCLPASLLAVAPASAQEPPREIVLPVENVRYDYAQVLSVRPVYQILRTTSMEQVCDSREPAISATLARVMNAVRNKAAPTQGQNCRMEPVAKEHRRTIAYDVDYMYRGSKFRTRMDRDPGNRLRIRISISPHPFD